jgi:ssDNA thymidine ADP-ribosyltransferase, DarT
LSTHKTFVRLGFTSSQAKALCKKLSTVVARCSYAVVQAHQNLAWTHKNLIVVEGPSARVQISSAVEGPLQPVQPCKQIIEQVDEFNNVKVLRDNSIKSLFHFTDVSNLDSIRKNGLLTWKTLDERKISSKMNSSELSHKLDANKGLADFVRLSFCKKHPMMYIALKEKRISTPVVLEIKLEVVSRPGVLFCEANAAAKGVKASESPRVVRFEIVQAASQQHLSLSQRPFYQGEVLVPDCIPPHLIKIPNVDAFNRPLEHGGRLPDPNLVVCTLRSETEAKASKPSSTTEQHLTVAAGAGTSTPEPRVSPIKVHIAGNGKSNQETFVAPKTLQGATMTTCDPKQPTALSAEVKSNSIVGCSALLPRSTSPTSLALAARATGVSWLYGLTATAATTYAACSAT